MNLLSTISNLSEIFPEGLELECNENTIKLIQSELSSHLEDIGLVATNSKSPTLFTGIVTPYGHVSISHNEEVVFKVKTSNK